MNMMIQGPSGPKSSDLIDLIDACTTSALIIRSIMNILIAGRDVAKFPSDEENALLLVAYQNAAEIGSNFDQFNAREHLK